MDCLRCGFPWDSAPCRLCGFKDDPSHLYGGIALGADDPFLITVRLAKGASLPCDNSPGQIAPAQADSQGDRYYLFDLTTIGPLFSLLSALSPEQTADLSLNGKSMPLAQELWLPLLRIFDHGSSE